MINDGVVVGFPLVDYSSTTAAIEALTGVSAGATAYSTDDLVNGFYNGTVWVWGLRLIGSGWALDGGGNARGVGAVDLQTTRASADQVASGNYCVIVGGSNNTASGIYCAIIGGHNNTASSIYGSFVGAGYSNDASGDGSAILAGFNNTVSGPYSSIINGKNNTITGERSFIGGGSYNIITNAYGSILCAFQAKSDKRGQTVKSSFNFSAQGDAQSSQLTSGCKTTNNTPEELFLDGDGGSQRITIASDTTWMFHIMVTARRTDADNESAAYNFIGCIDNNAGTTASVGSVTKTVVAEDTAGWDCNVTADDTNDALVITATGETSKTIQWVATIHLTETTG